MLAAQRLSRLSSRHFIPAPSPAARSLDTSSRRRMKSELVRPRRLCGIQNVKLTDAADPQFGGAPGSAFDPASDKHFRNLLVPERSQKRAGSLQCRPQTFGFAPCVRRMRTISLVSQGCGMKQRCGRAKISAVDIRHHDCKGILRLELVFQRPRNAGLSRSDGSVW